jgi:hypothetical protein
LRGEDVNYTRTGARPQKLVRLFAFTPLRYICLRTVTTLAFVWLSLSFAETVTDYQSSFLQEIKESGEGIDDGTSGHNVNRCRSDADSFQNSQVEKE